MFLSRILFYVFLFFHLKSGSSFALSTIVGTNVVAGGSESTCDLVDENNVNVCSVVSVKNGFYSAAHCGNSQVNPLKTYKINCFNKAKKVIFSSALKKVYTHPLKNVLLPGELIALYDSAFFETDESFSPLNKSDLIQISEQKDFDQFFNLNVFPHKLLNSVKCWSESYGLNEEGKNELRSSVVPELSYENNVIRYEVFFSIKREDCVECFQQNNPYGLFENEKILKIQKKYPVRFLTIRGDSGSPLYCKKNNIENVYVLGTLHGSLNKITNFDSNEIRLGSVWVPLFPKEELVLEWEKK